MSPIVMFASLAIAVAGFFIGFVIGEMLSRRRSKQADERYETLKRDFEVVSAVNIQLMRRATSAPRALEGDNAADRFLDLYDEAKRCLHRALDVHNATAARPIVIARDGGNLLQVLDELPRRSFSEDAGEDAGIRAWVRRVFELDAKRRATRETPHADAVLPLEQERELWGAALKLRA